MGHETALPRKRSTLLLVTTGLGLAGSMLITPLTLAADKDIQTRAMWLSSCPSEAEQAAVAGGKKDGEKGGEKDGDKGRAGLPAAVLVALAPKVIEGAVDVAAGALKAAGETKSTTSRARFSDDFYVLNGKGDLLVRPSCLLIVKGDFGAKEGDKKDELGNDEGLRGLRKASFYLEAKVKQVTGLKYFELEPVKLVVRELDHWRLFGSRKRHYNVAITLTLPGVATNFGSAQMNFPDVTKGLELKGQSWRLSSAASLAIPYPPASADALKVKESLEKKNAPFYLALSILSPGDSGPGEPRSVYLDPAVRSAAKAYCDSLVAANKARDKDRKRFDDKCDYDIELQRIALNDAISVAGRNTDHKVWAHKVCTFEPEVKENGIVKKAAGCENMPSADVRDEFPYTRFSTEVVVTEASDGSKFALFLGNALAASKDEVSKVLKDQIPKSEQVRDAENVAEAVAREATVVADLAVERAEIVLAEALSTKGENSVEVVDARVALVKAKIAANEAHRKAGTSIPYAYLSEL